MFRIISRFTKILVLSLKPYFNVPKMPAKSDEKNSTSVSFVDLGKIGGQKIERICVRIFIFYFKGSFFRLHVYYMINLKN